MRDELLKEIFRIVDKSLCPQIGIPLVDGRVELVLKPQTLQVLNKLQNEGTDPDDPPENRYDDVILTETERLKLAQFLRTVGKLPVLCLEQRSVHSFDGHIDLRIFKKLTSLKLVRINLKKLKWISNSKSQLSSLKCSHSTETASIFCDTLAWAELVNLSVNFCDIPPFDNSTYFKNAPWLKKLDLSHGKLKKCGFLVHLEHLEHLNLNYNFLNQIPKVHDRCRLQTLKMDFNSVADLSGLERMPTLRELDLSNNWIPDKYSLDPLRYLPGLISISLKGSPVSYIKFYRIYVSSCICPDSDNPEISIDGVYLSKTEKSVLNMKLFERKRVPDQARASTSTDIDRPSTSRGISDDAPTPMSTENKMSGYSTSAGKPRKTVRVPIIWDDSLDQQELNESLSCELNVASKGFMAPTVFPTKPMPTAEQNLNEELMAIREALIRCQPVAGSVKSLEENRMRTTAILGPESSSFHLGGITLPSPKPYCDESPKSEVVPATVLVQVHAIDLDVHKGDESFAGPLVEEVPPRLGDVESSQGLSAQDSASSTLNKSVFESQTKDVDDCSLDMNKAEDVVPDKQPDEDRSSDKKPGEDHGSDSGLCSDPHELVSSTECESSVEAPEPVTHQSVDIKEVTNESVDCEDEDDSNKPNIESLATGIHEKVNSETNPSEIEESRSCVQLENSPNPGLANENESPKDSDDESCYESDPDADELLWQVLRIEPSTKGCQTVFLALLESELKERSPKSGETLTKWPLDTVLSCVKTKNDPITIEMEFDAERKDRQHRVYVMEYADAKTLTKKIYTILESRPLSAMNQVSLKCLKCASMFALMKPSEKTKDSPQCPFCGNSAVAEAEEPKLPDTAPAPKPLSHATSHSSIAVGRGAETPGSDSSSSAIDSCSAASMEQNQKSGNHHNKKYESDIEVISNPSQSSIEVIDESSRSQSVTPRRKMSEERPPATPADPITRETAPLSALTESSSSGSLTESVITAYESHSVIINKKSMSALSLPEEGGENSPDNSRFDAPEGTLEEENGNVAVPKSSQDVYSFTDFVDVDLRVKTFIYHSVFKNENEELRALVRCHIWKTGGTDYDGCFVLSSSASYFLFHMRTDFSEQICDWLSLNESFPLGDIKRVQPIIWYQGLEIQVKNFSFLLLIMDQERTQNVVKHLSGLNMKGVKIITKPNTKIELSLQQAVLTSDLTLTPDDPTVTYMLICRCVEIAKGDESEEILRLAGLVITAGLFLLIPGDLSWLCSAIQPSIVSSRDLPSLIEVAKKGTDLVLRFFNEAEATEEKWTIKLGAAGQLGPLLEAVRKVWELKFSVPLEIIGL